MFAAVLNVLSYILGAALCLFARLGFWRGWTLSPHKDGDRSSESLHWWYGSRD